MQTKEATVIERFERAPAAPRFMARAFRRKPGLRDGQWVPPLAMHWRGLRFEPAALVVFSRITGLRIDSGACLLLPQVLGFRLQMALLTHPAYPLPIWTALQVRNRLVSREPIDPGQAYELQTQVGTQRRVDKGIEVDLVSRLLCEAGCCWEGRTTYFYRGRFGTAQQADPLAAAPELDGARAVEHLRIPTGDGWAFGRLTGDYNGIHNWNWYARRLGFARAFAHPQRTAAMCLARLPALASPVQTLDLWFKGPVFYGASVHLDMLDDPQRFGLALEGDTRYALLGCLRPGALPLSG